MLVVVFGGGGGGGGRATMLLRIPASRCRRRWASNGETCVLYCRNSESGAGLPREPVQFPPGMGMTAGNRLGNSMGFEGKEGEGFSRCKSRDAALKV